MHTKDLFRNIANKTVTKESRKKGKEVTFSPAQPTIPVTTVTASG